MARKTRTLDERIAEIKTEIEAHKTRIQGHQHKIAALEEKIEKIKMNEENRRKNSIENLIRKAKSSGIGIEEMAERLGISL